MPVQRDNAKERPVRHLRSSVALTALLLGGALVGGAYGQPAPLSEPPAAATASPSIPRTLTVLGQGHADVAPDVAMLMLGVTSDAPSAREALDKNNAAMTAVIEGLKGLGFTDADIQTTGLALNPQYQYDPQGAPKMAGYQAVNGVTLRVKDIANLGQTIDVLVSKGATQINGLSFDVADRSTALNDARRRAIEDAKAKADVIASAAGVTVGRIASISESYMPGPIPMMAQAARAEAAPAVPIAPGQVGLDVQVTVVYELN